MDKTYKKRIADRLLERKLAGKGAVLIEGAKSVATDFAEYFVDGTLLCTRWQYPASTEQRLNVICRSYENGTLVTNQTVERNGHLYTYTYTSTVTR